MIRRYKLGRDVELHKRTLERGLLSLVGAGARGGRGRRGAAGRASTRTRERASAALRCALRRAPTSAST